MLAPRQPVTLASKLMVPTHALFGIVLGFMWVEQSRTSPSLSLLAQRGVPPQTIGWFAIGIGVSILLAMATGYVDFVAFTCLLGTAFFAGVAYVLATPGDTVTHSSFLWPAYVAVCHVASAMSLFFGEVNGGRKPWDH